jgi:hypothetical protein
LCALRFLPLPLGERIEVRGVIATYQVAVDLEAADKPLRSRPNSRGIVPIESRAVPTGWAGRLRSVHHGQVSFETREIPVPHLDATDVLALLVHAEVQAMAGTAGRKHDGEVLVGAIGQLRNRGGGFVGGDEHVEVVCVVIDRQFRAGDRSLARQVEWDVDTVGGAVGGRIPEEVIHRTGEGDNIGGGEVGKALAGPRPGPGLIVQIQIQVPVFGHRI